LKKVKSKLLFLRHLKSMPAVSGSQIPEEKHQDCHGIILLSTAY